MRDQPSAYAKLSIQEQLDTYLICVQYFHPPRLSLAYEFARNGDRGVQLIVGKLATTTKEDTILDLIYALKIISDSGNQKTAIDGRVIDSIRDAMRKLHDEWIKARSQEYFDAILNARAKSSQPRARPTPSTISTTTPTA